MRTCEVAENATLTLLPLPPVFSAREEFVTGYGTEWTALLSKIKKRNERRREKGRCGKAAEFPDTMVFAVKPWTGHTPKMWQNYFTRDFG